MNLRQLRFRVREACSRRPWPYLALVRLRPTRRPLAVGARTDVVIEGFPRSGNTYAVAAFWVAAGRDVVIARHLHVPAQIAAATRRSLPTIVLVRKPVDAVASLALREPRLPLADLLQAYAHYYRDVARFKEHFVTAPFDEVTADFGTVMRRLNARFGVHYPVFEPSKESARECMQIVEQLDRRDTGRDVVTETTVARPSEARRRAKQRVVDELRSPMVAWDLERAEEEHARMLSYRGMP